METVDAYILEYSGLPFPVAEICVSIRPVEDCGFRWGISADVLYEDVCTGKQHAMPEERARSILEDIRNNDPEKWNDIERAARLNSRPDSEADYRMDNVYAA